MTSLSPTHVTTEVGVPPRPRPGAATLRTIVGDWLPAVPLLALVATMLLAPALLLVVGSFTGTQGELTLDNWVKVINRRGDQTAIVTSITLAATVATLAALIGAPIAWLLSRMRSVGRLAWLALLTVAGNFGGIGLGFAYFSTLGGVGMVTLALQSLGLPFDPPRGASFNGLVLVFLYTNVPLYVLLVLPGMGALRDDWWEAAQVASATRAQFWRRVGIPVLLPFLAAGWLLVFTWSIGVYGLAYALAGAGAASGVQLMTLRIGSILQSDITETWRANVLAVMLMLFAVVSLLAYRAMLRRGLRWWR